MKLFKYLFWQAELKAIPEKYRWLVNLLAMTFVLIFSCQFVLVWHHLVYLGPGLGDEASFVVVEQLWQQLQQPSSWYLWLFAFYLLFVVSFRAAVMLWSYFGYETEFGHKFPLHIVPLFMLLNAVGALSIPLLLMLLGFAAEAVGFSFNDGWLLMQNMAIDIHQWVMLTVPTVLPLPSFVALVVVFMLAGFVHYWLHRLGHESRALWLLFHRHHHMSPNLCQMSTAAVFFALPLFIVFFIPYIIIFASISKLFYPEPLYFEIFVMNSVLMLTEVFGHSDVFYNKVKNNRWVKLGSFTFGSGIYHYMHHSAEECDAVVLGGFARGKNRAVNMVNLGGGFFFIWDKLFGTFVPVREQRPRVGLIGRPELYANPVRLALSGPAQLFYELKHNKGLLERIKILLGPSDYLPPVTTDYAVKESVGLSSSETSVAS